MNKKISKNTLEKASEHLFYEIEMFYHNLIILPQAKSQIEINILLESFTVHARNLFNFFYPKQKIIKSKRVFLINKDDMVFCHYINKPGHFKLNKTKKKYLKFILRKIDKQVVHLTYTRNRYNQKTKLWVYFDIGKKMHKTINAFYESLPESYKNWAYMQSLKKVIDFNKLLS